MTHYIIIISTKKSRDKLQKVNLKNSTYALHGFIKNKAAYCSTKGQGQHFLILNITHKGKKKSETSFVYMDKGTPASAFALHFKGKFYSGISGNGQVVSAFTITLHTYTFSSGGRLEI